MKKYLIALAVALMVCLLGMTASAAERSTDSEDYKAAEREKEAISQACAEAMREMGPEELDVKTRMAVMTEIYEEAGWTVAHETPAPARSLDIDPEILELAYSDIDEANPEQREKIIDAREVVINQYSWQNDIEAPDCIGYMVNPFDREITFCPLYSELFPGWDPPRPVPVEEEAAEPVEEDVSEATAGAASDVDSLMYDDGNYYVPKASGSVVAPIYVLFRFISLLII